MIKKFTTPASPVSSKLSLSLGASLLGLALITFTNGGWVPPVQAQGTTPAGVPIPPQGKAPPASSRSTAPLEIAKDAPDRYVVVRGDTLWDISGKFLQKPWRWPEIWDLNTEQIKNPHWIFPGNVVYLDHSSGQPRLRLGQPVGDSGSIQTVRLSPTARADSLREDAIPTISSSTIAAFINRPLIVTEEQLKTNPRVVATQDGRVNLGRGDLAYIRGIKNDAVTDWHIYRQARAILDPDTRKPIAFEALFVGSAKLERTGDPATMRITGTSEEISVGDRLLPAELGRPFNYAPRPPSQDINGRIVSIYRGVSQVGRNSVVAINSGTKNGLEVGNVLTIKQRGRDIVDRETKEKLRLPDESTGHLLIFRVFDSISYGLVTHASDPIQVGDAVVNP